MSYSTYTITDGRITFDHKPMRTQLHAKQRILDDADKDADAYVDSGDDCDEMGYYAGEAELEYGSDLIDIGDD